MPFGVTTLVDQRYHVLEGADFPGKEQLLKSDPLRTAATITVATFLKLSFTAANYYILVLTHMRLYGHWIKTSEEYK